MQQQSERARLRDLIDSYWVSQAIHVAASLGVADALVDGPLSAEELASKVGAHAGALNRLLRALASIGLFAKAGGRFQLTPLAEYLRSDHADSVRAWAIRVGRPYAWSTWGYLLESVRTGESMFARVHGLSPWHYRAAHPDENSIYNEAMASEANAVAADIVRAYDFSDTRVVVDVGGGNGSFLRRILSSYPATTGILFDLPNVISGIMSGSGSGVAAIEDPVCRLVPGDFFNEVPNGGDLYILKSVLHDWSDSDALRILQRCRMAMHPEARLLIIDHVILPSSGADPIKFIDLNMLLMFGGREREIGDFEQLCSATGLRLQNIIYTGTAFTILEATAREGSAANTGTQAQTGVTTDQSPPEDIQ